MPRPALSPFALALAAVTSHAGEGPAAPVHSAPMQACIADAISLSGSGEPGHFYAIAVSGSPGPSPFLPGLPLDLGIDYVSNIVAVGVLNASGQTAAHSVVVPAGAPCGASGFSQMVTLQLGPIADAQKSVALETEFATCTSFSVPRGGHSVDFTGLPGESVTWEWNTTVTCTEPTPPATITIPASGSVSHSWNRSDAGPATLSFMGCLSGDITHTPNDLSCGPPE